MNRYQIRAMELHDFTQIWDLDEIQNKLDFMVRNNMNALVFHEPGIEDKIVFPAKFLGGTGEEQSYYEAFLNIDGNIYRHALRENLNLNRRDYMNHLIREAKAAGVDVYFENKELWFSDFILKYRKELMQDGVICPSDPFWHREFLPQKYRELFLALPDLAGIVVSIGTGEARLAISNTFACGCERCKNLDPVQWYKDMIMGMYEPFHAAGKKLVIRDFIYSKAEQERFRTAFTGLPEDIVLSLKNTPHDFYPTFPDNPLMGNVGAHPQWTEYDVNGQFFGWGAIPSAMLSDIRDRLRYGAEHGVDGFIARTDWEGVQDWTCFDNLNKLNLYAIAAYAEDINTPEQDIYLKWLTGEDMLRQDATPQEVHSCVDWAMKLMGPTWRMVERTNFFNGAVFSNDSCLHLTTGQFTFIGGTHHSLKEWDASREDALAMTPANIARALGDKDEALRLCGELYALAEVGHPALTAAAAAKFHEQFAFARMYVRGFRLTARGYCFSRYAAEVDAAAILADGKSARTLLEETIAQLEAYGEELPACSFMAKYPYDAMLNPERVRYYIGDLKALLAKANG